MGMDRTEAIVRQHLYCPVIIESVRKEVINCDHIQPTKWSNIKCGKLSAKVSGEISWNKLWVGLIVPYYIRRKGQK